MLRVHWFLPTGGDSREVVPSDPGAARPPSREYLTQVAGAADRLGFDAALTPCGTACEDAWITTATLVPLTRRLRFLVAFRPGLLSPTLAAQMASSYQRLSGGRLMINIVAGAESAELARFGDWGSKEERYERCGEFLRVLRGALGPTPFDWEGPHYRVAAATTRAVPATRPPIYFGGASAAAERVAASWADCYLLWGETPAMVAERIHRMRELAEAAGRGEGTEAGPLQYGIRFHVITRNTSEEAWAEAGRLLDGMDPALVAAARADFAGTASEGQRRMAELSGSVGVADATSGALPTDPRELEVHPGLWAGVGLVRGGAGTALVGSHGEVADLLAEYAALGLSDVILSGYPHLEEAYHCGEGLLPELRRRGLLDTPAPDTPQAPVSTFR